MSEQSKLMRKVKSGYTVGKIVCAKCQKSKTLIKKMAIFIAKNVLII